MFLFCVFYVFKIAFKEEEEGGHFVPLDLWCELASSSMLAFVFHED